MTRLVFFFLVLVTCIPLHAQSPGGHAILRWVASKADAGVYSDNGTTPAVTDATAVQQWNDQSTITNHAGQTTAANKPAFYNSVINGYPALRFSGDQFLDALATSGINATDSWTFFFVFH